MGSNSVSRRAFLTAASTGTLIAFGLAHAQATIEQPVPNSSGTDKPKTRVPENAVDSHIHVMDARFPSVTPALAGATAEDYRRLQKRIGTSRVVIVTPRNYVDDNSVTLDAIRQNGSAARGVAVVRPTVSDAELRKLNDGGIRGIRFTVGNPKVAVVSIDMIEPLARRVADLGWHVQLNMTREQIAENADLLRRLPTQIVFDHLASLKPPAALSHPAYGIVRELLDKRRAWVKLSAAYSNSLVGPPTYSDATQVAQALVTAAPERLVWGSDWPHTSEVAHKPDDAVLFDLLASWAPDEATRNRILVANPADLYGFN